MVRQSSGPSHQVIPFKETLCETEQDAINTVSKYINLYQDAAHTAQVEHMNIFNSTSLV